MPYGVAAQFRNALEACGDDAELQLLLASAASELRFDYYALIYSRPLNRSAPRLVHIDNYPEAWATRFIRERLYMDDPVLRACLRANVGFTWDEIFRYISRSPRYAAILEDAAALGLRSGYTVPSNVPYEPAASCTFATSRDQPIDLWRRQAAQLIGGDVIKAARRIHGWITVPLRATLSPREREILFWITVPKSNTDIATILGISQSTVKTHVSSILHKLDVKDRIRAAMLAERAGLIFSDLDF